MNKPTDAGKSIGVIIAYALWIVIAVCGTALLLAGTYRAVLWILGV
jgi:hypothetical protein